MPNGFGVSEIIQRHDGDTDRNFRRIRKITCPRSILQRAMTKMDSEFPPAAVANI